MNWLGQSSSMDRILTLLVSRFLADVQSSFKILHTEGYDFASLRQFIKLFPLHPLTKLLKGYFAHISEPLPMEDGNENDSNSLSTQLDEDSFDMVLVRILSLPAYFYPHASIDQDGFTALPGSIFAHRIVAELYLLEEDYQNAIRMSESGLELVRRSETDNATKLTL